MQWTVHVYVYKGSRLSLCRVEYCNWTLKIVLMGVQGTLFPNSTLFIPQVFGRHIASDRLVSGAYKTEYGEQQELAAVTEKVFIEAQTHVE